MTHSFLYPSSSQEKGGRQQHQDAREQESKSNTTVVWYKNWVIKHNYISSLGRQNLVTQVLVKITFIYKLVAKKLDFVLSKLQISIWKDRATVAW